MVKILYTNGAVKQLQKIGPAELKKAKRKILSLADYPLSGKELQGEYKGQRSLRAWPLRIIYIFDTKSQTLTILDIDYRGDVYK